MRFFLAFTFSLLLLAGTAFAEEPKKHLQFHHIHDLALLKFAVAYFRSASYDDAALRGPHGLQLLRRDLMFAKADINDDGIPELFLVLNYNPYCGSAGCEAAIFQKMPRGYELICDTNFDTDAETPGEIFPQKDYGYHRIQTPEAIIHWSEHLGSSPEGSLCWHEDLND